ncbi:MAG: nitric oxide reductase NorD protein [Methanolobus sp.]|nr:nitric oxide reductase NorD protein [Methanolobus sp.]
MSKENTEHVSITKEELLQLIESKFPGRNYHHNLLSVLKKSSYPHNTELLRTVQILLDRDRMKAGLFLENLPTAADYTNPEGIRKWAGTGLKIFDQDKDLAVDYFSFSAPLLKDLT